METKVSMDPTKIVGEMINFMKNSFITTIQTISMLQDQTMRIMNTFIDQGLVAQQEARKVLQEWTNTAKKATADFQKMTEENFDRLSSFFK